MEIELPGGQRFLLRDEGDRIPAFCYGRHGEHICYMSADSCRSLATFLNTAADNLEKYGRVTGVVWDTPCLRSALGGTWFVSRTGTPNGWQMLLDDGTWTDRSAHERGFFPSRWLAEAALAKATQ